MELLQKRPDLPYSPAHPGIEQAAAAPAVRWIQIKSKLKEDKQHS
jgi:hypothetical protein